MFFYKKILKVLGLGPNVLASKKLKNIYILNINFKETEDFLLKTSKIFNLLNSGDALINLFDFTVLGSPNRANASEHVEQLINRINTAKQCKI
jgi:hypothetical protein